MPKNASLSRAPSKSVGKVSWYGLARWKRLAAQCLARDPVCKICHRAPSTIADHVEPHRGNEHKFWYGALQGLCKPCHDRVKQRREIADDKRTPEQRAWINDIVSR